jgi:hypothetical protein
MSHADWAPRVHHALKLQEDDYEQELGHDKISEPILSSAYKTVRQMTVKVMITMTMTVLVKVTMQHAVSCSSGLRNHTIIMLRCHFLISYVNNILFAYSYEAVSSVPM